MKKLRKIIVFGFILCMLFAINITAFASGTKASPEILDSSQKGSVTVDFRSTDTGEAILGGTFTLYKVAVAKQVDGDHVFQLTDSFAQSNVSLEGIKEEDAGAKELASVLEIYAERNHLTGDRVAADENGQAVWKDLELGLYLVVNTDPAEGYVPINSFLISVPRYLDGAYVYDVQASPKVEAADSIADPEKTSLSTAISNSGAVGNRLPQTGQLWWPVPVLAFAGVLLVILGWHWRRNAGGNEGAYE